jgi:hypothetical protein
LSRFEAAGFQLAFGGAPQGGHFFGIEFALLARL